LKKISEESERLEDQINKASVKEHEIVVVSALIEEKARLAESKTQLKKNCKEEKSRLDEELEKMKKRREDIEQDEQSEILRQIDEEFDAESEKVIEQKKILAASNREITIV